MYRKQCAEHFKYAIKFRDFTISPTITNSSNHNNITPSKNDIEDQSKVIPNSGDGGSKHVNKTKNTNKTSSKQYSPKPPEAISVAAGAATETEP